MTAMTEKRSNSHQFLPASHIITNTTSTSTTTTDDYNSPFSEKSESATPPILNRPRPIHPATPPTCRSDYHRSYSPASPPPPNPHPYNHHNHPYGNHHHTASTYTSSSSHSSQVCSPRATTKSVFRTLIFLTAINPIISIFTALYTILILLLCIFTPHRIVTTLHKHLIPRLQTHFHYLSDHPEREPAVTPQETSAGRLVVLLGLVCPILAIPTMLAAAVVVVIWLYAEVLLGDESKGEGVEYKSYLWVSTWWEKIVSWPITGV